MYPDQSNQQPYPAPQYDYPQNQQQSRQNYYQQVPLPTIQYQQAPPPPTYGYQAYYHPNAPTFPQSALEAQNYQGQPSPQLPVYYTQPQFPREASPKPVGPIVFTLQGLEKHADKIAPVDGHGPTYTVAYNHHTFTSKPVLIINSSSGVVATADYHSFSDKIDLVIDGRAFTLRDDFESTHGGGQLFWKLEGSPRSGILKLKNRVGECMCTFSLREGNKIEIWADRSFLNQGLVDEIIVTLVAQRESVKRKAANQNATTANAGVYAALATAPGC